MPNEPKSGRDADLLTLRYSVETVLDPRAPTDDLLKYTVEIVPLVGEDGEPGDSLGWFSVWRFHIAANRERNQNELLLMFDDDSEEAADLYEALFDPDTDEFREDVLGSIVCGSDVLYFQTASFPKAIHRAPMLLAAAERVIETIGSGCGCAALWLGDEPYPDRKSYGLDEILAFWESQKDSEAFWGRIGFKRVPETLFLVRNLAFRSPAMPESPEFDVPDE